MATDTEITDPDQVAAMVERVSETLGPIDVLVNNAGSEARAALEVTDEAWHRVLDVNLGGVWRCSRLVRRSPRSGRRTACGSTRARVHPHRAVAGRPARVPAVVRGAGRHAPLRPTRQLGPAAVFLASEVSSFMTGSVLVIDGGYTLF